MESILSLILNICDRKVDKHLKQRAKHLLTSSQSLLILLLEEDCQSYVF